MDSSYPNRMPAPSTLRNSDPQLPEAGFSSTTTPVGEIDGRVDQLALVQNMLRSGATPTLVAGIAMLIAQMQAQKDHADLVLKVSSGIESLVRTVRFHDRVWHKYDITHSIGDIRSHMTYGEPTRPPVEQERPLQMQPATLQPSMVPRSPPMTQGILPTPPPQESHQFNCTLPAVPLPILTTRMQQAVGAIKLKLHASFHLSGVPVDNQHTECTQETTQSLQLAVDV